MLASITPFGERSRGFSWRLTTAAFAVGAVGAGAAGGAALGGLGGALLPAGGPPAAALAILALTLAFDTALRHRLPSSRRQVNEDWLRRYRGWVYGAGFGAQLGVGVATIVSSAAVYAAVAFALLAGSAGAGAAVGAAFGLARALSLLAARGVRDPEALVQLHRRMEALEAPVTRSAVGLEVALLAVTIAWAAL